MTRVAPNPSYLLIEDRLDAIGQKYRVQRILRGAMLWTTGALVLSVLASLAAHLARQGVASQAVLFTWITLLLAGAIAWIVRPLLIRPDPVRVARLVESRVEGLHNGLTNSLLLARRDDISKSPWLPQIYDEILLASRDKPLDGAIRLRDLLPLGTRLLVITIAAVLVVLLAPGPLAHGWQQMFSPTRFVPKVGAGRIVEVRPGDVTLVAGQPLEITLTAKSPGTPNAKLFFDAKPPSAPADVPSLPSESSLVAGVTDDGAQDAQHLQGLRYTYRADHVDYSTRYRVEVAGTQSPWYSVTVVKQVKLRTLTLAITPPTYTRQAGQTLSMKADEVGKTPIAAPLGSKVEIACDLDVPVGGAMLQAGDAPPLPMEFSSGGRHFSGSFMLSDDTDVSVLLTEGGGQVIARLPDPSLLVRCVKDAAPVIEMKWPTQDVFVPPAQELKIVARIKDDYGLARARVLMSSAAEAPTTAPSGAPTQKNEVAETAEAMQTLTPVETKTFPAGMTYTELSFVLNVPQNLRQHGSAVRVQVEATDNRDLAAARIRLAARSTSTPSTAPSTGPSLASANSGDDPLGPQTVSSAVYEIRFRDPEQIAREQKQNADLLRQRLMELLKTQEDLHGKTVAMKADDRAAVQAIQSGQTTLRQSIQQTAEGFHFEASEKIIQKSLLMLSYNPGREAIDLCASMLGEPVQAQRNKLHDELRTRQRRIIGTLQSLLALLNASPEPTTQPTTKAAGDLDAKADAYKKLNEALKEFLKQEQRILDQTAALAKKPVDNWDDADKKKLEELKLAQEKMESFLQEKIADFSKLAEQDMSNASLLKELLEVYSEVTMSKSALKAKATEVAVALEDSGLELAKEIQSNIEKWLMDTPDRAKWAMEDPVAKTDTPMAELPKELEDMVGELMEEQEDLFDEMEDTNANWTDSGDKGIGWDAADGPIANMTAKGVTGNQQPNNNEMGGRSGEGRSGKSQGEMVEDTATGKGGRDTPTRLDPTPFAKGQIKNESKDPTGGATGGGKISGQGGAGLEGPVPPQTKEQMQRLAQKQAELRNKAERLDLKYKLGRYDNFKLLESIALMRRVESDISANRYQNALRRKDVTLDAMGESRLLLGGEIHVQQDTSPRTSQKLKDEINDAMKGQLPPAWSDALKQYYRKLAEE